MTAIVLITPQDAAQSLSDDVFYDFRITAVDTGTGL